jgi:proline dehydrogenase
MDERYKAAPAALKIVKEVIAASKIDFANTEIALKGKTDAELRHAARLFRWMNNAKLVKYGSKLGLFALKYKLPFAELFVKKTIFGQFCGGTTLLNSTPIIEKLIDQNVQTILDFGAEGKQSEIDYNNTMNELLRAIEFGAKTKGVTIISIKITGLARFELLEKMQTVAHLNQNELVEYRNVLKRVDAVCNLAAKRGIIVYIDAEESWIQNAIDHIATLMMVRYNKEKAIVFNTFQLYRTDKLQFLIDSFSKAQAGKYILGAKLVRGAYMEKERDRAEAMNYPSPIHKNKQATDNDYDQAVRFCTDNLAYISFSNASHNANSALLQTQLMAKKGILPNHTHTLFAQLYGMSDNLTFNLAHAGFNTAKYTPYGQVEDVVPYLIRRAQENSAVTGDMSREYQFVMKEMKRRGLD